jgi:outer membrane protein
MTAARSILHFVALGIVLLLPSFAHAQGKIGLVDADRVLRESAPVQRAEKKLKAEFDSRDQELARMAAQLKQIQDEMDRTGVTLSDSQRRAKEREFADLNRDFQRKQREFREDLNQRRNEELGQLVKVAEEVIRRIAQEQNLDLVLRREATVYASPRIDITEKVIKALEDK